MVTADLITGFLGSGKTTFIRKYAEYLIEKGQNIGILENDYGAINVDMMLLKDLEGESCELEMVAGGCDEDCHRRRFKTKLISMGMSGYNRVIVEPSGIYDTDEFFDVLYEEPICNWYKIGSVISIVDACLGNEQNLSAEAEYILAAQLVRAGIVVLSRTQLVSEADKDTTINYLNEVLAKHNSKRVLQRDEIIDVDWDSLGNEEFTRIMHAGSHQGYIRKQNVAEDGGFESLYFMNHTFLPEQMSELADKLFSSEECGSVFRIKGFAQNNNGEWFQLNAKRGATMLKPIVEGQQVFIVIGENLNEESIRKMINFEKQTNRKEDNMRV